MSVDYEKAIASPRTGLNTKLLGYIFLAEYWNRYCLPENSPKERDLYNRQESYIESIEKKLNSYTIPVVNEKSYARNACEDRAFNRYKKINGKDFTKYPCCKDFLDLIFTDINPNGKNIISFTDFVVKSKCYIDNKEIVLEMYLDDLSEIYITYIDPELKMTGLVYNISEPKEKIVDFIKNV